MSVPGSMTGRSPLTPSGTPGVSARASFFSPSIHLYFSFFTGVICFHSAYVLRAHPRRPPPSLGAAAVAPSRRVRFLGAWGDGPPDTVSRRPSPPLGGSLHFTPFAVLGQAERVGLSAQSFGVLGFLAFASADLNPATVSATKKDSVSLLCLFVSVASGRTLG